MKNVYRISGLFLFIISLFSFISCENNSNNNIPETITDIDGNIYHSVVIGSQVWMVENLKTTRFNDGASIPLLTDNVIWSIIDVPAYCWLNNNSANKDIYGALYNWYTVGEGYLCPVGWHVPTDDEWTTLAYYLGGTALAGGKLKETGTTHWLTPNIGATNESGFTALPGAGRSINGQFGTVGNFGNWWSSMDDIDYAFGVGLTYNSGNFSSMYATKRSGFSVRCIQD